MMNTRQILFTLLVPAACAQAPDGAFDERLEIASNLGGTAASFERFADGAHDLDDIQRGRISPPADDSKLTKDLLRLTAEAETYGEAMLLARAAGQHTRGTPPVPAELSPNPADPDWEFEGDNVALPYDVQVALDARRLERDKMMDVLDKRSREAFEADENRRHQARRRVLAESLGRRFDPRDDLYVAVVQNSGVWRRKKPVDHVVSTVDAERGSGESSVIEEAMIKNDPSFRGKILGGTDSRSLRSRHNGYLMTNNVVWAPKGAIVDDGRSTNEVPVEVDCTGVKIRERLVATAGHCQFKNGSWNDNTKWIPAADGVDAQLTGSDPSPLGYKNAYVRIVRGPWYDHEWANYDFGLFVLYDNSSSCSLAWHGWSKRGLLNQYVHLYGYPGERLDCSASPLANDNCNGSIYGTGGTISYAGSYRVRYPIDTQPGQSGTGFYVIDGGTRYVVGVHRGEYSNSRNQGVRINAGNRDMINDAKSDYPPNACN